MQDLNNYNINLNNNNNNDEDDDGGGSCRLESPGAARGAAAVSPTHTHPALRAQSWGRPAPESRWTAAMALSRSLSLSAGSHGTENGAARAHTGITAFPFIILEVNKSHIAPSRSLSVSN